MSAFGVVRVIEINPGLTRVPRQKRGGRGLLSLFLSLSLSLSLERLALEYPRRPVPTREPREARRTASCKRARLWPGGARSYCIRELVARHSAAVGISIS